MLVEIFEAEMGHPVRCIAVQYSQHDIPTEAMMRKNNPLFDTVMPQMSDVMKSRIQCGSHRTAIFLLDPET